MRIWWHTFLHVHIRRLHYKLGKYLFKKLNFISLFWLYLKLVYSKYYINREKLFCINSKF